MNNQKKNKRIYKKFTKFPMHKLPLDRIDYQTLNNEVYHTNKDTNALEDFTPDNENFDCSAFLYTFYTCKVPLSNWHARQSLKYCDVLNQKYRFFKMRNLIVARYDKKIHKNKINYQLICKI